MQPNSFDVIRIPTKGPGDVSGLTALIDSGALEPSAILAALGKTEGNGGVNDFTREYAVAALCNALARNVKRPLGQRRAWPPCEQGQSRIQLL
jgi:cyanuric acid amidohydrolase